ncbi:hypothetical protein HPB47_014529 [Ixodes persulcatus]|uniref:Uncharacterized protein n=1 Tax=Ixodes persulcatus TaxID=34615 RepID=A0AC60QZD6_IXOPE|nr:hypothetical protein HPB47_014529 [Ixodes persulcatus]
MFQPSNLLGDMPPCEARLIEEKLKLRKVETPWRLAVIASFTSLIATPFYRTSGIMYVLLIEEFNISREQASRLIMFQGSGVHVSASKPRPRPLRAIEGPELRGQERGAAANGFSKFLFREEG